MKKSELENIALAVERAFTPFAFKCECGGEDKSCLAVLQSEPDQIRFYQLQNILRFIREIDVNGM